MLDSLFGGRGPEKVLLYLANYREGYARAVAATMGIELSAAQRQLSKFESAGILVSQKKGRTRLFLWNPRYPFLRELQALLEKALKMLPDSETKKFYRVRKRPRRSGKPI